MRKIIYKYEFEYLCLKLEIKDRDKAELLSMFQNTPYDINEFYELKPEFLNYNAIKSKIRPVCNRVDSEETFIKRIFTIGSDLEGLPDDLLQEIKQKRVAVFVGAGLSKLISREYPLWGELADSAIDFLEEKGKINFFERERLKKEIPDPKQKLSIFEKYLEEGDTKGKDTSEFAEFMNRKLGEKDSDIGKYPNPYHLLCSDTFNFIKVTSNMDIEFVNALKNKLEEPIISIAKEELEPQKVLSNPKDVTEYISGTELDQGFSSNKIYMIHGHVDEPCKVVLTTEDYINEYFRDKGTIRKFLKKLFDEYTVLFISYGLSEFPILERIFSPKNDDKGIELKKRKKHYILLPTYLSEISYFKVQEKYFEKLGIAAIPYYLDSDGYSRICKVLESWESIIKEETIDKIEIIDLFLKEEEHFDEVIKIIRWNEHSFNYFFRNIKGVKYWDDLKTEKFFNPERFFPNKEHLGNYESYRYTPIIYIEAISEEIKNGLVDADRYSQEIIDIIRQVSDYSFMYGKLLSYAIRIFFIDI